MLMHRYLLLSLLLLSPLHAEPLRIVALGDSITKGVRDGVTGEQTFAALLQAGLSQNGIECEVTNAGIGGERTDQALRRLQKAVIERRPHLVTVMYGTNDSWVDQGKTESRLAVDVYEANLRQIIADLSAAGIQAVLMTEPMFGETNKRNRLGEDGNVRLTDYVERCRKVAAETKTPLIDHFAHWAAEQKRGIKLQDWTTDGCHPNPAGHANMAHRILQTVLPLAQPLADKLGAWRAGLDFRPQLIVAHSGYDGETCWVHARAGVIPGPKPEAVMTMQKLLLTGSDVFYALNDTFSTDGGLTWSAPREHADTLGRRQATDDVIVAMCDFWPKWHAASGKLLGIGHSVRYQNNHVMAVRQRETCWSVFDAGKRTWSAWQAMPMPDEPQFWNVGAGCAQRVDLDNGEILLPVYGKAAKDKFYGTTVLRCGFDGTTLRHEEHGNTLVVEDGRGAYEPSLARCKGRFFLTMRNDTHAYISTSTDGLHYSAPQRWTWDDGSDLGSYNTQAHWVTHGDRLYLVYTRRGPQTDHIIRHRAPLYIAEVDTDKLHVIRKSERILVPERGARLGNFGVTEVSDGETWVTVTEWMQKYSPDIIVHPDNPYQADNRVWVAKIRWQQP